MRKSTLMMPQPVDKVKTVIHRGDKAALHVFPAKGNGLGIELDGGNSQHVAAVALLYQHICRRKDG